MSDLRTRAILVTIIPSSPIVSNCTVGIGIQANTNYKASLYYRFPAASKFKGKFVVSLQDAAGTVLASQKVSASGSQTSWKQVKLSLSTSTQPGSINNMFAITVEGNSAAGETINFAMLSLFPPTFKNRENGMRQDIAQVRVEYSPDM